MEPTSLGLLALIPLMLWRMVSRVRRLVGRQRSTLRRHWIAAVLFPLLIAMLAFGAAATPMGIPGLAAGLVGGVSLALAGLRLTQFEVTQEGYFYTPNTHIGIALSLLFIGRVIYRLVQVYGAFGMHAHSMAQDFLRSPLTLGIFGTLAGYYTAYAIGMLLWRRRAGIAVRKARLAREQSAPIEGNEP
jgi:hypothetical protein